MRQRRSGNGRAAITASQRELVREALPILHACAQRMWRRFGNQIELDELISLGLPVITQAVRMFDPKRSPFPAYLAQRINWSMVGEARRRGQRRVSMRNNSERVCTTRIAPSRPCALRTPSGGGPGWVPSLLELGPHSKGEVLTTSGLVDAAATPEDDPEQTMLRREATDAVKNALTRLPAQKRRMLERHYYHGRRFDQVAAEDGISRTRACRLHKNAIAALADQLQQLGVTEAPESSRG